jgi:cobalamin biosynthesis Mg chelatase CobN
MLCLVRTSHLRNLSTCITIVCHILAALACRYLQEVSNRLFSEGLHQFGAPPSPENLSSYLSAYLGDRLPDDEIEQIASTPRGDLAALRNTLERRYAMPSAERDSAGTAGGAAGGTSGQAGGMAAVDEGLQVRKLLEGNKEELASFVKALGGGYVLPEAGGDLLRDGPGVLPTGARFCQLAGWLCCSANHIHMQAIRQTVPKRVRRAWLGAHALSP